MAYTGEPDGVNVLVKRTKDKCKDLDKKLRVKEITIVEIPRKHQKTGLRTVSDNAIEKQKHSFGELCTLKYFISSV